MKLAVIAANGQSGKAFVDLALDQGHKVRAGIHGGHNLKLDKDLELIECDATKLEDVQKLIKESDAVLSFIGHTKNSPADVQTKCIKNVIKACKEQKVTRLISLTGTGVRFPNDKISIVDTIANKLIYKIDPERIEDGINHVEVIKKSNLDWTIIRVLKLNNEKAGKFKLTENGPAKLLTPRQEVALACLEVLNDKSFIGKAPIISKA